MAACNYCQESAGFWKQTCADCRTLEHTAERLAGHVGFTDLLDGLEQTGIAPEKIMKFIKANPDGQGSVQDRLTSNMTNELLKVMGINERQTPADVSRIRKANRVSTEK